MCKRRERERERPVMSMLAINIPNSSIKDIVEGLSPVEERPIMSMLAISITNSSIKDIAEGLSPVELNLAIKKNMEEKTNSLEWKATMLPNTLFIERYACAWDRDFWVTIASLALHGNRLLSSHATTSTPWKLSYTKST